MAIKSTIFKAALQIADIDHAYYADHTLTLARHPSETDERMMVRLAALALQAYKLQSRSARVMRTLAFGAGLSDPDEPDVLAAGLYTGRTRLWVEVGQPEEKAAGQGLRQGRRGGALLLQPCCRNLVARHREQASAGCSNLQCVAPAH